MRPCNAYRNCLGELCAGDLSLPWGIWAQAISDGTAVSIRSSYCRFPTQLNYGNYIAVPFSTSLNALGDGRCHPNETDAQPPISDGTIKGFSRITLTLTPIVDACPDNAISWGDLNLCENNYYFRGTVATLMVDKHGKWHWHSNPIMTPYKMPITPTWGVPFSDSQCTPIGTLVPCPEPDNWSAAAYPPTS